MSFPSGVTRRTVLTLMPGLLAAPAIAARWPSLVAAQMPGASPLATDPLSALLQKAVDGGIPGLALLVQRDDQPPIALAAGVGSIEHATPISSTDRFRIYSITKTFTAIVTLQLADEQMLSLDDVVTRWLTQPAVLRIPNIEEITVRQLLNHTSGIYDYFADDSPFLVDAFFGPEADWSRVWTPEELLAYAASDAHPPYAAPGKQANYANTNYILLGLIVEQVTRNPFAEELRRRILLPLELKQTFLASDEAVPGGTVDGYHLLDGELVNVSGTNTSWAWAGGGMVSTTDDIARFLKIVMAGTLLSSESFAEMFGLLGNDTRPGIALGMGIYRVEAPFGTITAMDGESAGFSSLMCVVPDAGLSMVLLANMAPGGQAFETLRDDLITTALATI